MKFIKDVKKKDLNGKVCLLRVDFNIKEEELKKMRGGKNIPLRIERVMPTIRFLLKNNSKIIILSHRGRPKSKDKDLSLKPFANIISKLIKKPVKFISFEGKTPDFFKEKVFLLENLRFSSAEEKNSERFAKDLASLGDFYVNDAFSVSHRANASVEAITKFLPSYAGFSMEEELTNLDKVMKKPKKPFVFVLGGAKVSDKIDIIKKFIKKADYFLLGGGMANTFFAAEGLPVGKSLYEKNKLKVALEMSKSPKIVLPVDANIKESKILDIGPETAKKYSWLVKKAETVVWNGPMGYIEKPEFRKGSEAIKETIMKSSACSLVGGGETSSLFAFDGKQKNINPNLFISTGGGAMLEYLSGKKLPGIEALKKKK